MQGTDSHNEITGFGGAIWGQDIMEAIHSIYPSDSTAHHDDYSPICEEKPRIGSEIFVIPCI